MRLSSGFFDVASRECMSSTVRVLLLSFPLRGDREGAGQFGKEGSQHHGAAQGPFGLSCALLTGTQLWDGDWPDSSLQNPRTVVVHRGMGGFPAICL